MTTIPGVYTSMTGAPPQKTSLTIDTEMEGRHHHHMDELIKITALVIERPTPPRTTDIVTSTQPHIIIRSTPVRTRTTRADHTLQKVPPMIGIGVTAHHHPLMDHVTTRGTFLMRNRHVIDTALPILPPLHTERTKNPQGGEKETHKIGTVMSPRPITGGLTLPIGTIQADRRM